MYRALWDLIPLPVPVKVLMFLFVFLAVVALLFAYAFPYIAQNLPYPFGQNGADLEFS